MRRVWVTRDEAEGGSLSGAIAAAGMEPVLEPVLARRLVCDPAALVGGLGPLDWLVLTSTYAIEAVPPKAVRCRVAVVGEASRALAAARGLRVALVGPDGSGSGLWRTLAAELAGNERVCFPRSSLAPEPGEIGGVSVESPVLYQTAQRAFDASVARRVDAVAVASPSAAEAVAAVPGLPPCGSIGPTTSAALRRCGVEPRWEAPLPGFAALAAAIAAAL